MKIRKVITQKGPIGEILRPWWWRIWLISGLSVVQSVLQVGLALCFRGVIDSVIGHKPDAAMWSVLLIADLILQVAVHCVSTWYSGSVVDHLTAALRKRILSSAVNSADARLEAFHSGELVNRSTEDVRALCDGMVHALPALVGQLTRLAAAFAAVLHIYPSMALILLAAGAVMAVAVAMMRPMLKKRQLAVRKADAAVTAAMQEDLQQVELIQGLDVQEQILQRFGKRQKKSLRAKFHQRLWSVGSASLVNAVAMLGTGVLLLWGAGKVAARTLSYGSLTSLIQLLNQFRTPVLTMSGLWTRLIGVEVATERLTVLLETPQQEKTPVQLQRPAAVVFENVTFRYEGEETPVVENFSLRLPLDGWTCLGGFSGRGKSTLFKLILGLHTPQEGRVYLETAEGEIPCDANTRRLFAYVPQDYALFSGTVLENLLLVAPEAEETVRHEALRLACAEFVYEMAEVENTVLRENNTGLSKGQIQRLAIARAILMDRPILLLDECTSALDAQTEQTVLHNLHSLGKGTILVTHRPEALESLEDITAISMEK